MRLSSAQISLLVLGLSSAYYLRVQRPSTSKRSPLRKLILYALVGLSNIFIVTGVTDSSSRTSSRILRDIRL